jgi:long-chain acyl-CoA synthetase
MNGSWTLQTFVRELADRGGKPCLVAVKGDVAHTLSCAQVAADATALAWGLIDHGIRPGETIGIMAPNGPDWVIARLGLGLTGALVHAMDDLFSNAELKIALDEAKLRRVLTSPSHVDALREIDPTLELIVLADEAPVGTLSWRTLFSPRDGTLPPFPSSAPAMLVNTSGTTGRPKAFILTSEHLWANVGALITTGAILPGECILLPLPLHHVYPFTIGILTALSCRGVVVFPEEVAGPQIVKALALANVAVVVGVPRLYTALVGGLRSKIEARGALGSAVVKGLLNFSIWAARKHGINAGKVLMASVRKRLGPNLRMVVSGGALLPPDVLWALVGLGLTVRTGWGLAETASIFTGNLPGGRLRYESEGKVFCDASEIRIVSLDGSKEGEIQIKGPSVFAGYINNEQANKDSFTEDGWFRTGDVGFLDKDGFLFVTGRIKETLVLGGGKKLHPDDLEKDYASPYFKELAILEHNGALVALVLPDEDAIRASVSPRIDEAVRVALQQAAFNLPSYERLSGFRIVREPLPKTRLMKFQRFKLPAIYAAAEAGVARAPQRELSPEDKALLASEPAGTIFNILKTRYPDKPVSLDASPLLDLGIDSLEWVGLALVLEQQARVHLDESMAGEATTIRELLRKLSESESTAKVDYTPAVEKWLAPSKPWLKTLGDALNLVAGAVARPLFHLEVHGLENLPAQGPFVITPNHESDLDPIVLAAALGPARLQSIYWAADATRVLSQPALQRLGQAMRIFPADDRRAGVTLAVGAEVLRRGSALVWFPESWRSPDGMLQRFLPGIGRLLIETRVPAVPVHIEGAFEAMPRTAKWPRFLPVSVTFGKPLAPEDYLPSAEASPQAVANRIHDAVAALELNSLRTPLAAE